MTSVAATLNAVTALGEADSYANGINDLGQIVGSSFLVDHGTMVDLNALIDPASNWVIEDAAGINDLGQIAGRACRDGVCQAVRLDLVPAVPEPSMFALLLSGVALAGWRRKV